MNDWGKDYLAHHGIKGMKWGVRRYQNEDGSLTVAGKKKYADKYKDSRYNAFNAAYGDGYMAKEKAMRFRSIAKAAASARERELGFQNANSPSYDREQRKMVYPEYNKKSGGSQPDYYVDRMGNRYASESDAEAAIYEQSKQEAAAKAREMQAATNAEHRARAKARSAELKTAEILYENSKEKKINTALLKADNKARAIVNSGKKFIDNLFKKKSKTAVKKPSGPVIKPGPTKKTTPTKPRRETK